MALSRAQMARMDALLEQALELDRVGRECWLQDLGPEDRDLEPALRRALLGENGARLDTRPKLGQAASSTLKAGDRVGPYQLLRELGSGGMAEVWLAQRADGAFKREVALKLPALVRLRKDLASRFARERDILAALEHPNIARLYDAGVSTEELPYLAMEYVAGQPLTAWCDAHQVGVRERLKLFLQVLDAVQYAHGRHVLHRDLKPSNILVTEAGQVRLLDFGVAKLLAEEEDHTQLTQIYGRALTPEYASPELLRGDSVDATSDIYALGVVLYELLAGSRPYRLKAGASLTALEQAVMEAQVQRPSTQLTEEAAAARATTQLKLSKRLRGDLDAIVLKALAREPRDRYSSAEALADDVQRYLYGEPVEARPASAGYRIGKFVLRHRAGVAGSTASAIVVAVAVGYALTRPPATVQVVATATTPAIGASTASIPNEKSIAVLPFVDMSEKKDQEYFSDGLSEELIDLLSKVPDLRVPARTSSFYFKGKSEDVASIAQKLRVAHVLEGSVRRAGDRLRVTAQLIRADNGYHLWSQTYDRRLRDILQVQDDIAGAVVAALKIQLLPSQQLSSARRTQSAEAYNQYLLGRQFFDRFTLNDSRRAIKAYRKAIELDPNFAAAYAGLSTAEFLEAEETGDNAGLDRAMASAEKAVALAPDQAEGDAARGYLRDVVTWDWPGAQADLQKALALDPGNAQILARFASLLRTLGRLPEASAAAKKAVDLDPLSGEAWYRLASILRDAGQFAAAQDAIARALEISPDNGIFRARLGSLQLVEGRATEAAATYRQVDTEVLRLTGTSMAEHSLGHVRESQQALDELIARHAHDSAYFIAEVYAWRHEKDKAFEWLDRAYRQRDLGLIHIKPYLAFASLHGDPRFGAFLRKMKLPE